MFKPLFAGGFAALLLLLATTFPTLAASGQVLGVKPAAQVEGKSTLVVGADVFIGDKVVTGAAGLVQIKFQDKTELVVGPNSALVIEDYLLREDNSAGRLAINALSGTFRFATGTTAQKDRYTIQTPSGTIGVRGTAFDFNVSPDETNVLLFHGAVFLCNTSQSCVTLSDTCDLGTYSFSESKLAGNTWDFTPQERRALESAFPYAQSQAALLGQFRLENARECLNKPAQNDGPPDSLVKNTEATAKPEEEPCGGDYFNSCDNW